jgi:hypothetical protein
MYSNTIRQSSLVNRPSFDYQSTAFEEKNETRIIDEYNEIEHVRAEAEKAIKAANDEAEKAIKAANDEAEKAIKAANDKAEKAIKDAEELDKKLQDEVKKDKANNEISLKNEEKDDIRTENVGKKVT